MSKGAFSHGVAKFAYVYVPACLRSHHIINIIGIYCICETSLSAYALAPVGLVGFTTL